MGKNGLDTDKDGIIDVDLKAMGAVVGQRDLFVEIDIMDKLKISQKSLDIVAEQFKKHNIYLHIDAGPDSVDYVTGKNGDYCQKVIEFLIQKRLLYMIFMLMKMVTKK